MSGADVYNGLISRGFGPVQASVLSGNAQQESSFNPAAWNAESGAGGLMQWRGPRLQGLLDFAASKGTAPADVDTQLDYIKAEMSGPEAKNAAAFLSATDVPSANAALKQYLRYGPAEGGNRLQYSQAFANQNKSTAPMSTSSDLDAIFGAPSNGKTPNTTQSSALDSILGPAEAPANSNVAVPPPGLQPYSKEYADWAVQQVKAGKTLPQVSPKPPEAVTPANDTSLPAQISAGFTSAANAVPVAGPTILNGLESAKAALYGVPAAQIHQEDQQVQEANPLASGIGTVAGTTLPLLALPESALLGTSSDATVLGSNLLARALGGAASSGVIGGADTLMRGGNVGDVERNALLSAGVGGALPVVAKGLGAAWQAFKGPSATKTLSNALTADQIAPDQVSNLLTQSGNGSMVADLGPNTQQLAGSLASLPGEPQTILKQAMVARAADTGNRLTGDVASTLGTGRSVSQEVANLSAKQSAAAKPLYDAVRDVQVQPTPAIDFIRNSPLGKAAFEQGANMAANDGYSASGLTVGTIDYAKQALDDIISSAQRSGNNNLARQATQMVNSLKSETDAQVPLYAAARDAYAGPAKVKDAIALGQSVFSKDTSPEDLQAAMTGMSSSERDGLLLGAQSAVQSAMGNAKNDAQAVKSTFASDFAKQKLAMLIGPDAADQVSNAIDREANFANTKQVVMGNSLTAARQAGQKAVAPETMGFPSSKSATWTGLLLAGIEKARNAATSAYRNAQNVKLANMLTQGQLSPRVLAQVQSAAAPANRLIAPAALTQAASIVPQNDNAPIALPRRPIQITVRDGNSNALVGQ